MFSKKICLLASASCLSLFSLSSLATAASLLSVDPSNGRHFFKSKNIDDQSAIQVGWAMKPGTDTGLDYDKLETDADYLAQNSDLIDASSVNVLYNASSAHIMADLDEAKASYEACTWIQEQSSNHCDLTVAMSSGGRYAFVALNGKWDQMYTSLFNVSADGAAVLAQSADLTTSLSAALAPELNLRFGSEKAAEMSENFRFGKIQFSNNGKIRLSAVASGGIPKSDDENSYFDSIKVQVSLKRVGNKLVVQK